MAASFSRRLLNVSIRLREQERVYGEKIASAFFGAIFFPGKKARRHFKSSLFLAFMPMSVPGFFVRYICSVVIKVSSTSVSFFSFLFFATVFLSERFSFSFFFSSSKKCVVVVFSPPLRAESEKVSIKMQTDDLKAAHDHLATEKVGFPNEHNTVSEHQNPKCCAVGNHRSGF